MSASKFKFISPGVFLEEIDNSRIPSLPDAMGPLIIGTSKMGPAFRPTKVESFLEFTKIFGAPGSGGLGEDVWRDGSTQLSPDYGAYAAKAYLANNGPLTFMRVLGLEDSAATAAGQAGWIMPDGGAPGAANADGHRGGAFALFLAGLGASATFDLQVNGTGAVTRQRTRILITGNRAHDAQDASNNQARLSFAGTAVNDNNDEFTLETAAIAGGSLAPSDTVAAILAVANTVAVHNTSLAATHPNGTQGKLQGFDFLTTGTALALTAKRDAYQTQLDAAIVAGQTAAAEIAAATNPDVPGDGSTLIEDLDHLVNGIGQIAGNTAVGVWGPLIQAHIDTMTARATFAANNAPASADEVIVVGPASGTAFSIPVIDEPDGAQDSAVSLLIAGTSSEVFVVADGNLIIVGTEALQLTADQAAALNGQSDASIVATTLASYIRAMSSVRSVTVSGATLTIQPNDSAVATGLVFRAKHFAGTPGSVFPDNGLDAAPATLDEDLTGDGSVRGVNTGVAGGALGFAHHAATIYADVDTLVQLGGAKIADGQIVNPAAPEDGTKPVVTVTDGMMTLHIGPAGGPFETIEFNLVRGSDDFIRKKLNTNPTLTNEGPDGITPAARAKRYWLGASHEGSLAEPRIGLDLSGSFQATLLNMTGMADFQSSSISASTPWVLSQHTGDRTQFSFSALTPLFRLVSMNGGSDTSRRFKVSIANVKAPSNPDVDPYGTFSIIIRDIADSDSKMVVYQRFDNINLNPGSGNYIARAIGDQYYEFDPVERRLVLRGVYPSNCPYFRVEVTDDMATGAANPELLPCAFQGPDMMEHFGATTGVAIAGGFALAAGNTVEGTPGWSTDFFGARGRCRQHSSEQATRAESKVYYGYDTTVGGGLDFDKSNIDLLRYQGAGVSTNPEPQYCFSVELIKAGIRRADNPLLAEIDPNDGVTPLNGGTKSFYIGDDLNLGALWDGLVDLVANQTISGVDGVFSDRMARIKGFTLPVSGGFDGFDVTEADPLCQRLLEGDLDGRTSCAYNTLDTAIDIIADPEFVECNMLAIPGCSNADLTDKLALVAEQRGDALAVIDLPGIYEPATSRTFADRAQRTGDIPSLLASVRGRAFNSSYACAYAPWIQIWENNVPVWLPASIAGIGTMGSSSAISEVWFAPAGFNRGGLDKGSAGLAVGGVSHHLTSKNRDDLYDLAINPIASFPSEGIVIFGQKTLQGFQSALDRINVRRLLIHIKKRVSQISSRLLFEQNIEETWLRFSNPVNAFLGNIQAGGGLTEYRVVLDETTTTPDLIDRNIMYAKVLLKPARAIEFIAVDFVITNTGASFDD